MTDLETYQRLIAWIATELARRGCAPPLIVTRTYRIPEETEMEF